MGELADALGIDRAGLERTVAEFNAATTGGEFDPAALDGLRTDGIEPPKSNWALPLDEPPFVGYAVTCGVTFTFGGLKTTADAQVLEHARRADPRPVRLAASWWAGSSTTTTPAAAGLTAGAVFGRIAGRGAAGG